jgi:hypothetical protein
VISGTPTGLGSYGAFRAKVTDAFGNAWTDPVSMVITAPTVTVGTTQSSDAGTAFSLTPSYGQLVSGGSYTRTYTLVGAPSGMTINTSGMISWATPVVGTYPVTIQVRDTDGSVGSGSFTLTVYPLVAADGGGSIAPTTTASTVSNVRTITWTYPQLVYINRWTAQVKAYKTGGYPKITVTLQYMDSSGAWVTSNSSSYTGSYSATTSTSAVWLGPSNSATSQIESKKFRIILDYSLANQSATSPSVGTSTGMK